MKKVVQPPSSNTGVERTKEKSLRSLVDWVRVTFFTHDFVQICADILQMDKDDFVPLEKGGYRYKKSYVNGNIKIYCDGIEPGMGVLLDMSGKGCRQFEASENFTSWKDFFTRCLAVQTNFPRIDIAIDDFKGYFTMKQIDKKIDRKEISSRFKAVWDQGKRSLSDSEKKKGKTLRFGSRESMICIRFYDKLAQMENAKKCDGITFWNRVEIEAKDDRARAIVEMIADDKPIGEMVKGVLKHYMRFLVKNPNDTNKRRWKTWRNWERFLGGVSSIQLSTSPEQKTIQENIEWLEKQVSKTLLKVVMAESVEFLQEMFLKKQESLTPLDYRAIEMHVEEKKRRQAEEEEKRRKIKARLLGRDEGLKRKA